MKGPFLVIDTTGRAEYPAEALTKLDGLDVRIEPGQFADSEALVAGCGGADVLMVTAARITDAVLAGLPRLRGIVRYGVGLDAIDLEAAARRGVEVRNVRGFCVLEMADHALAFILAFARDIPDSARRAARGEWSRGGRALHRVAGRTLGLVGLGAVGGEMARRGRMLGMEVAAYDPYADEARAAATGARLACLDDVLRQADYLSVHCALTDETRHLLNAERLRLMKTGAVLVNTARGGIVDEAALVQALREGRLAGAGLDVLDPEPPPPDHPLLGMDNVLVTPHVSWESEEAKQELVVGAFGQLADVLRGGGEADEGQVAGGL